MNLSSDNASTLSKSTIFNSSAFVCPLMPYFIWDLNNTTSIQITTAIVSIACPVTILLNISVILAVKRKRVLMKKSNILLSSLAAADLLVGAVSMPLTITVGVLVLQEGVVEEVVCTIDHLSDFVMYSASSVSLFLLVLIAWERYIAVVKWWDYKTVTRSHVTKYARMAWFLGLLTIVTITVLLDNVPYYEVIIAVDIISSLLGAVCLFLIAYCYLMVYRGVRKWNRSEIHRVNVGAMVNTSVESKAAETAFLLTVFVIISSVPTLAVYTFGGVSPSLRKSSFFQTAETMVLLNSLFNPLLYCFRDRVFRKAVWRLLRLRKPRKIQAVHTEYGEEERGCRHQDASFRSEHEKIKEPSFCKQ